jgi:diaminohydroxyphosphoribosylaminopyrimidine deaminase/5-amino-6-(5-phosphoribosylamino)uracil reductase
VSERFDPSHLQRTLLLAARGGRETAPNPRVGAVVVRDGAIVGEGWHERVGGDHAEVRALSQAAGAARGAVLYSSLEPCAHRGRTPPCTEAIIAAGVTKVVIGLIDPDPRVSGRGVEALREAGIEVDVASGELAAQASAVIEDYVVHRRDKRSFAALKVAGTLDGRIADHEGVSRWITGSAARAHGRALRERFGAIVVGVGTAIADDPLLLPQRPVSRDAPFLRAILDPALRTPPGARILRESSASTVLLYASPRAPAKSRIRLESEGSEVVVVGLEDGQMPVRAVLEDLALRGVLGAVIEGGGRTHGEFLRAGLVDKLYWYQAPVLLGDESAVPAVAAGRRTLADAWRWRIANVARLGDDVLLTLYPAEEQRRCSPESSPRSGESSPREGSRKG